MWKYEPKEIDLLGSLITFFHLKKTAAESRQLLVQAYGEHAPSQETCELWFERFKIGDFEIEDREKPDRLKNSKVVNGNGYQSQEELSSDVPQQAKKPKLEE